MKPVYTYFGRGLTKKDKGTRREADLGKQVFGTSPVPDGLQNLPLSPLVFVDPCLVAMIP
ncbi:MAG TPA: hypothetical protein V6D09_11280 [Leptolyngbyaceae cyanobacterium]